jgi:hypothetical protein
MGGKWSRVRGDSAANEVTLFVDGILVQFFVFPDRLGNPSFPETRLAEAAGILCPRGLHGNRFRQLKLVRITKNRCNEAAKDHLDFQGSSMTIWATHNQSFILRRCKTAELAQNKIYHNFELVELPIPGVARK